MLEHEVPAGDRYSCQRHRADEHGVGGHQRRHGALFTPWLDCGFLPNIDGQTAAGPNFPGTNPYGGMWELQVTDQYLWGLGEFRYVDGVPRRAIARWTW